MNKVGNLAVLGGECSHIKNKRAGQKTKISYEDGQCIMHLRVPAGPKKAEKEVATQLNEKQGFSRQAKSRRARRQTPKP